MSEQKDIATAEAPTEIIGETSAEITAEDGDDIDELDDMEFLLEEIENRIAPLA